MTTLKNKLVKQYEAPPTKKARHWGDIVSGLFATLGVWGATQDNPYLSFAGVIMTFASKFLIEFQSNNSLKH